MRLTLTVVDPVGGNSVDAVLDADPETPVSGLVPEFMELVGSRYTAQPSPYSPYGQPGAPAVPPVFVDGAHVDPGLSLADSPIREGAVVSLHHAGGCPPGEPSGFVELRVVGGPGAGAVHRLGVGRVDIGSAQGSPVRIADPSLEPRALTLRIAADGRCKVTVHGGATIRIDGKEPETGGGSTGGSGGSGREERIDWPLGSQIALGNSILEITPYYPPDAALRPSEDGAGLDYNRPPRLVPPGHPKHFKLPSEPDEPDKRQIPWIMAVFPVVGAVMMAVIRDRWIFLLLALLSPIMLIANYFMSKKSGWKKYLEKLEEYKETKARVEKDAQEALVAERFMRRHASPDPGTVLNNATGPRTRLWERRRSDDDHLLLRVGTCELDSEVVLTDPDQDEHKREVTWKIADAPVTISLKEHGVVGFAAPGDMVRSMGRWALGQIAVLHSPNDVQIYVLTDTAGQAGWEWVRWLPHSRPVSEQNTNVLIGTDAETVAARLAELTTLLDGRTKALKKSRARSAEFRDPDIVVVFDGSRRMRQLPGVIRLLKEGPAVGMYALCLEDEERFLPGECQAVAVAETGAPGGGTAGPWQQFQPGLRGGFPGFGGSPAAAPQPAGRAGTGVPAAFGAVPGWQQPVPQPAGAGAGSPLAASPMTAESESAPRYDRLRVGRRGQAPLHGVLPDLVSPAWCGLISRSLAPLRDISDEEEGAGLPNSARLLDVLELEPPTPQAIAARWQTDGQSTVAVIGQSYDGAFALDIRRDGPHGLIAGTTGSGKSELLQTIVASLAVANTPDNMTFVLVDYKGGSAFKDCVQLPHTVGMVTDLDNLLVERALRSLGAELTRREHILLHVGAKDIEDYQDLLRREPGRHESMPRLLIVIDEFASMARELPDFVKGLVNIAQRGRSLGIHLLLATQRPTGVVSPEIRANTNLRIALRVTDASESNDVLDAPDAAQIQKSTPGRAYVRLGAASLLPFQAGRVGGRRPGAVDPAVSRPWSKQLDWYGLGREELKRPPSAQKEDDENTDLKVLVAAVNEANRALGIPAQHSPWLPPLDEIIQLEALPPAAPAGALPAAPWAIEDLPDQQDRRSLAIDFKTFGHLLVSGAPRTGRSQLLRTIAGSLARTHSAADVHLYAFDCGNGALNILTRLPHCGAVVGRAQVDRAKRLLKRLVAEVTRRQELLAQDAMSDIGEQRAAARTPEERLPHIVIMLDRWEGWTNSLGEVDTGALTDQLFLIMREGASVGVHVIITGDQKIHSGRISSLSEEKYTFRLQDRTDYSSAGLRARDMPEEIPAGRLFRSGGSTMIQVAVLSDDLTGQGQAAALTAIGDAARQRDADLPRARRPFRVDVLPARLTFADAWEMRDPEGSRSRMWSLIGVGGDELTGYGPDLSRGQGSFIIAGQAKSGRSTALYNMARVLLGNGVRLVLSVPRNSPLLTLQGQEGVLEVFTAPKFTNDRLAELFADASPENPMVFMADDAEDIRRVKDMETELEKMVVRGTERGIGVVVAGDETTVCSGFSGWQAQMKKARRGVLLSPATHRSGDLIGLKLPRSAAVERPQPGNGILHLGDGQPLSVRLPLPD